MDRSQRDPPLDVHDRPLSGASGAVLKNKKTHISLIVFNEKLASSGPYRPLLARSGYPGQDASFYDNPMVMICATVNALMQLKTILYEF